jgi:methyltransferase (TIGR00027 family)
VDHVPEARLNRLRRLLPRQLHDSQRPSATAQAVTLYRALELRRPVAQRIVSDPFAPVFLTAGSRALLGPLAAAAPLRDLAAQHDLGGLSTYVLCRHRFIDEHLLAESGASQILVLGAGYDSRAYRFATELAGRPVYEVDLPPLSRRKADIVAAHSAQFAGGSIVRVEIDFRRQALAEVLRAAGFAYGARTFVVWEGVAPYLDAEAVDGTLSSLRAVCGPGSVLAMDLWDGTGGPGLLAPVRRLGARAIALIGEPVTFGIVASAAHSLLAEHGFEVCDLADATTLATRYATGGRRSFESLYVLAARLA